MKISRAWWLVCWFFAGLKVAVGQVELVVKAGGEPHAIAGVDEGRIVYVENSRRVAVTGEGDWEFRSVPEYAEPLGAVDVTSFVEPFRADPASGEDRISLNYRITFHAEKPEKEMYFVAAWEVNGEIRTLVVREFPTTFDKDKDRWVSGYLVIKQSERHGFLRAYLMKDGRSIRGVRRADLALAPFRSAVDDGDNERARAWLAGAGRGQILPPTMLEQICMSGSATLLETVLAEAPRYARGRDGEYLLLASAQAGRENCVKVLLQKKVDPNTVGDDKDTALYRAVRSGSMPVVLELMSAKAKTTGFTEWNYRTPLTAAVESGDPEMIKLMLENGAHWPDKTWRQRAFREAVMYGRAAAVQLMIERAGPLAELSGSESPLILAAQRKDHAMMKRLLDAGLPGSGTGFRGFTALMAAAAVGDEEAIGMLRKAGSSLAAEDYQQRTAAAFAIKSGYFALGLKLWREAPLSGPASSRLLHDAVLLEHTALVSALLAAQATTNAALDDFNDVIIEAVRSANLPLLQGIVAQGYEWDRPIHGEWNLAGVAARYRQAEIIQFLEQKAGRKLVPRQPPVAKLPIGVVDQTLWRSGESTAVPVGSAQVDLYIDSKGCPRLPLLRSSTNAEVGRAALLSLGGWRFNSLPGKSGEWRRVIVPFESTAPAGGPVFTRWQVDEQPWLDENARPKSDLLNARDVTDAAWVRFEVTPAGKVTAPVVLSATAPGLEEPALAMLKSWHFFPAKKGGRDVACVRDGVILLPAGLLVDSNSCVLLSHLGSGRTPARMYARSKTTYDYQLEMENSAKHSVVLVRFKIDREGMTKDVVVVAAPDPKIGKLVASFGNWLQFKSLVLEQTESEYPMMLVQVFGDANRDPKP
ncbi:MAG: hypothetical protein JWM32_160 [Verrucomicrobia bacterium]|nr:hypothetical protein [Verrucomicrobiota bacterium]